MKRRRIRDGCTHLVEHAEAQFGRLSAGEAKLLIVVAAAAESMYLLPGRAGSHPAPARGFVRLAAWTAGVAFAALVVGTYVRATGSGLAFRDWPLMDGRLVPTLGGAATWMFLHRVFAALSALLVLYTFIRSWSRPRNPVLSALSAVALALMAAQVLVGAADVPTVGDGV